MAYQMPALTDKEETILGKAVLRQDERLAKSRDTEQAEVEKLQADFDRRRQAIADRRRKRDEAIKAEYRAVEDRVSEAILDEENRTGVARERAPIDMVRWIERARASK